MSSATATKQRGRHPQAVGRMSNRNRWSASYDAAQTNHENMQHWAAADALSANRANAADVRAVLRNRARYEYANNSYCSGMLRTQANDTVGTGPTLQLLLDDRNAAERSEVIWRSWARAIRLADKLRTARLTRGRDGEVLVMAINNPRVRHPVKLDIVLLEGDQCATPTFDLTQETDGIVYDRLGNPITYHILNQHPGEFAWWRGQSPIQKTDVPASRIRHLFRRDRPGQRRGIPEITPALPLYALLRRYTLASVAAAETAADLAAVITSKFAPDGEEPDTLLEANDLVEIVRRAMMVLPEGYDIKQFDAKHPTTTYAEFKNALINEIARVLNMPFNVAAGNSSGYNYSSGKLDHQVYFRQLEIDREDLEIDVLDWLLEMWLGEATLIPGLLPIPDADASIPHVWFWTGLGHIDPYKEAQADASRLMSRTLSLSRYYARQGLDWRTEVDQIAEEERYMRERGITVVQVADDPDALRDDEDNENNGGTGGDSP